MSATFVEVILEEEGSAVSCSLEQIRSMLATPDSRYIPDFVCKKVEMVFTELTTAQNIIHGQPSTEEPEYSVSAVVSVVGTVLALHKLQVETISCGSLPLGEGSFWSEKEGLLPVPSPTTLQLLIGMPTCPGAGINVSGDLITPTAAALLRALTQVSSANGYTKRPPCFITQRIGVGVDAERSESRALRLWLGEATTDNEEALYLTGSLPCSSTAADERIRTEADQNIIQNNDSRWKMDQLTQLEANLDDMTAEALAFAVQILLDNGAVDAWVAPIVMKKGRAAHTLHCLIHSNDAIVNKLLELTFRHTTTLGVRIHRNIDRAALRRSFLSIQTPYHESDTRVKIGYLENEVVSVKAEFDDCARISRETNVPIQQVADYATQQAHVQLQESKTKNSKDES